MIKKLLIISAVALASAASVKASSISGTIGYTGSFTPVNTDLTTVNDVVTISGATLTGPITGSFAGGTLTHFASPITINTTVPPGFTNPLWQLLVGAITYSFTASDVTTVTSLSDINTIRGNGSVSDGLGNTATGTYNLSFTETAVGSLASFTFAGTSGAQSTPDGGATLILLGSALAGMGILRRKLA